MVLTDSDLVFKLKSLPADTRSGLLRLLGASVTTRPEDLLEKFRGRGGRDAEVPAE